MSKKTAFYDNHVASNAQLVDFHGWELPLHYGSQIEEHQAVRQNAGMFDVSHMTVLDCLGAGGRQLMRQLLANDVDKLPHTGRALYSCMLNHRGGILDDLIVYNRTPDNYRLILNSATREKDMAWLQKSIEGLSVGLQERPELAMLAIQGPNAIVKAMSVFNPAQADAVGTLANFEAVEIDNWFIARTGYTGEDGLEVLVPSEEAPALWDALLKAGVQPCGLGARDSLRLEAGLLLYGQDMDETTTPLESGLGWTIAWEPEDRAFIGRAALELQKQNGVQQKLVGLVLSTKQMMRTDYKVFSKENEEGVITSGAYSPTLDRSIAIARVPVGFDDECEVEIRGQRHQAKIVKPRFVKFGKSLLD